MTCNRDEDCIINLHRGHFFFHLHAINDDGDDNDGDDDGGEGGWS